MKHLQLLYSSGNYNTSLHEKLNQYYLSKKKKKTNTVNNFLQTNGDEVKPKPGHVLVNRKKIRIHGTNIAFTEFPTANINEEFHSTT